MSLRTERDEFFGKDSKQQFRDKFVTNGNGSSGYKLTADGCSKRYDADNVWRDNELMSEKLSNTRDFMYPNRAVKEEHYIMNCLAVLDRLGFKDIQADESVPAFIDRHQEVLDDYYARR